MDDEEDIEVTELGEDDAEQASGGAMVEGLDFVSRDRHPKNTGGAHPADSPQGLDA